MRHLVLIFGGKSGEHEVSCVSARYVAQEIPSDQFRLSLVLVQRSGVLERVRLEDLLATKPFVKSLLSGTPVTLARFSDGVVLLDEAGHKEGVDVVFPLIHGPLGEDGAIQGWLEFLGVQYVGCEVLGSALGMDKIYSKTLLMHHGIPVTPFLSFNAHEAVSYEEASNALGSHVLFVKPSALGSSVGISRVSTKEEYVRALMRAFSYGEQVLIEKPVIGREIECAVLGNTHPRASCLGEVRPKQLHEFYSYEAKYLDPDGAELIVPAALSASLAERVRDMAVRAFRALGCVGMARVDFFVTAEEEILVNEINTVPGFTSISMYPRLWQESGVSYPELIKELIALAQERFLKKQALSNEAEVTADDVFYPQENAVA